jgi:hypothetical protein
MLRRSAADSLVTQMPANLRAHHPAVIFGVRFQFAYRIQDPGCGMQVGIGIGIAVAIGF